MGRILEPLPAGARRSGPSAGAPRADASSPTSPRSPRRQCRPPAGTTGAAAPYPEGAPTHPEAVGHHHQQRALVHEPELLTEKAGIGLRLAPQRGDRPRSTPTRSARPDRVAGLPGGRAAARQLRSPLQRVHACVLGQEQRLCREHVRCGVAVGARGRGRHAQANASSAATSAPRRAEVLRARAEMVRTVRQLR